MKFYLSFFDNIHNKPSFKFNINLFFFKLNQYCSLKQLNYLQIFLNIQSVFKIKLFKLNYTIFNNIVLTFLIINILLQLYFLCVYL